jgi:hypothetical protein
MPNDLIKIDDQPITRGMNSVDDARDLRPGECRQLTNGIPGNTVVPRNGCAGVLLSGSSTWRFVPPGLLLDTTLARRIISLVHDFAVDLYRLLTIPEDTTGTDHTDLGAMDTVDAQPKVSFFGMVKAHDCMIVAVEEELVSWKADTKALGHKVVEADGQTVRDLCIRVAPAITGLTQTGDVGGPFNGGGTAQTFTASAATDILTKSTHGLATGDPFTVSNSAGALPGGLLADTEYYAIYIDGDTFYAASSYANAIAGVRIDLTSDGTGTNQFTETSDCFAYAFTYVRRNDADAWQYPGSGGGIIIPPHCAGEPTRIDTPLPGMVESITDSDNDETIAITSADSKVTIDIGSDHATAIAQGATHLRVWRSRRFRSTTLAADATKFFVADLPLGVTATTFDDTTSDAALEGELTQLTMADYTEAPFGAHIEFAKNRLWIFSAGIGYYSETPGTDGGCPSADAFAYPQKWASMFRPSEYYVDCESRDGQESRGIARLEDDLYFFKESKIHVLLCSDPMIAVPTEVSAVIGCEFPHSITKAEVKGYLGKCLLFLSNRGPMVITQGGQLRPFSEFKIKELWPKESDELYGQLTTNADWIRHNCSAAFLDNTWYVFYLTYERVYRCFAFYFSEELMTDNDAPRGAFEVTFANLA